MGDFVTLGKYNLNAKIIVIKNNALGQIKWEQMVFLGNPEYRLRARADRLRARSPRAAASAQSRSTTRRGAASSCATRSRRPARA